MPAFHARDARLWWPMPLATIIWLLVVWSFAHFLTSPEVEMSASAPIAASFVELPEAAPAKSPDVQPRVVTKKSKPRAKPRRDAPPPAAVTESRPAMPAPPASPEPASELAPPTDMMSYVNAARARRNAAESAAARENAAETARERGPSAEEARMANIRRNLQPMGTNGVFQIISMSVRTGKYSFRGWTSNASNARREVIEVDAGPDGDVERAMVRSMIELIRRYYKGDFNWESQRLERSIVLSARMEDNAGLEDFLWQEFFGARGAYPFGAVPRKGV
ncbi:MAG: hypothetical protein KKH74_08530 [Gammaproteobacteria bacterium]|nr:hypothetical protein [Gammaproteobacteria bacterium]MBU1732554.1 hypothetical protein [Gammaproteobacteria bacterium]MBU1893417.1 hypothetical protein [Gammaproteobacteria bacterium]